MRTGGRACGCRQMNKTLLQTRVLRSSPRLSLRRIAPSDQSICRRRQYRNRGATDGAPELQSTFPASQSPNRDFFAGSGRLKLSTGSQFPAYRNLRNSDLSKAKQANPDTKTECWLHRRASNKHRGYNKKSRFPRFSSLPIQGIHVFLPVRSAIVDAGMPVMFQTATIAYKRTQLTCFETSGRRARSGSQFILRLGPTR